MTPNFEFATPANPEQTQQLGTILSQCFNSPLSEWSVYLNRIGVENFRVLRRQGGQVAGGLAVIEMGQWFGGCSVPMAGVAAVGIPPEYRGMGAAVELLSLTLKEIQAKQVPISVLYPATQYLYRQVGYEQGGTAGGFEMRLDGLRLSVNREIRAIPMHSVTPIRHEVFHEIYRQWAVQNNGNLDRNSAIWQSIIQPREQETIYAYLVGSHQPEGYIIFKQDAKESQIVILDWVALSAAAAQRLWMFLADHRSQIQKAVWRGAASDPFLLLLAEQTAKVRYLERWMLRIIDVPKALEIRGYPVGVETELHLAIIDELLPENNGNFILSVSGGRGEVTRGGKGELQLNIRGLAPLYTGLYTPSQLQVSGYLAGTDNAVAAATQIFAGAEPWMPDHF